MTVPFTHQPQCMKATTSVHFTDVKSLLTLHVLENKLLQISLS